MKNDRNGGEISPEYDLLAGKMGKIYTFGAKNFLIYHELCPSYENLHSMKCLINVYLKSLGSDKLSDTCKWLDMERTWEKNTDDIKFCEPSC